MNPRKALESDLVVLTPDSTFRDVVEVLLERPKSLGIRPISATVFRHARHDPGCLLEGADFLRRYLPTHARALVVFDRAGCGREDLPAVELEQLVGESLCRVGWEGRAKAIVLDPELEVWAWSESPEVERCLGWVGRQPPLREWLRQKGMWEAGSAKPKDPKAATRLALFEARKGAAPPALLQIARSVSPRRCTDRAFVRFRGILQRWFPTEQRQEE